MPADLVAPEPLSGPADRGRVAQASRWGWMLMPIAVSIVILAWTTEKSYPVTLPLLATLWVGSVFYASLRARMGTAVVELGTVYAAVVSIYTIFPLLGYIANGLSYTPANDARLFVSGPTPAALGRIAWLYVGHLATFALAYRLVRRNVRFDVSLQSPGVTRVLSLSFLLAAIYCFFLVLGRLFDISAPDYAASYLTLQRLPLLLAQITNHLGGMRLPIEVAILVALFTRFRRFWWLIAALLLAIAVTTFVKRWSRTEFVLLSAGVIMLYHWFVRPIAERGLIAAGAVVISLFLAAGVLRSGVLESKYAAGWNIFSYSNEFESVFATSYDLERLRSAGLVSSMPLGFYLGDLLALVPQQLSPIRKMNPADWYAKKYYPYAAVKGYGFGFGSISESIVGGGILDVLARGAVLGALLAAVHRWASSRGMTFWPVVVYAWATLTIYQSFRNTTFYLLVLFFYRVLPVVMFSEILVFTFRRLRATVFRGMANAPPLAR